MHKAFTLIELLVSLALIALMTTAGFLAFGNYSEKKQLQADTQALAAKLGEMRARAFSGQKLGAVVPNGYGIYTNQADRYIVYADLNNNFKFDAGDTKIEEVMLGSKIKFAGLNPDGGACFKPGQMSAQACDVSGACGGNAIFFTLRSNSGTLKKIMITGKTGVVSLDATDCPGPYHLVTADGVCAWNCGANTAPDKATNECLCVSGTVDTHVPDAQGRRVCGGIDDALPPPEGY